MNYVATFSHVSRHIGMFTHVDSTRPYEDENGDKILHANIIRCIKCYEWKMRRATFISIVRRNVCRTSVRRFHSALCVSISITQWIIVDRKTTAFVERMPMALHNARAREFILLTWVSPHRHTPYTHMRQCDCSRWNSQPQQRTRESEWTEWMRFASNCRLQCCRIACKLQCASTSCTSYLHNNVAMINVAIAICIVSSTVTSQCSRSITLLK